MLRAEFRHIEANVGAIVSEQQTGDCLCELRFSDTGRAGQECNASWSSAPRRLADSGDGAFDDIQHVGDGMGLTLYPSLHEFLCRTDLVAADLAPGTFRYADLEASDRVRDPV